MKRTDLTLTAALCASLLLHGLVLDALIERETHELALGIPQSPINLAALLAARATVEPIVMVVPPVPPPPKQKPKPLLPPEELFGERHGQGRGLNSVAGAEPMEAPQAPQDQATLTPRPGHPSDGGAGGASEKRPNLLPEQATAVAMAPFGLPNQPPLTDPLGNPMRSAPPLLPPKPFHLQREHDDHSNAPVSYPSPTTRSVAIEDHSTTTQPVKIAPTTKPIEMAKKPQPTTASIVDAAATQPVATTQLAMATPVKLPPGKLPPATQPQLERPAKPEPQPATPTNTATPSTPNGASEGHGPSGDMGHPSESESDPFSQSPKFIYRDGKVEARDGRKVKTVKPKLTEAGIIALQAMDEPIIEVWVKINEKGKVIDVGFIRKSNIPEVDEPHYRAAWEWEFEPSRDKNGHPHPDTLIIPFIWH